MTDHANPYIGPLPFTEGKALYGREQETQVLFDLLISKRIVLLISPSGAGKTSLIQAALLPQLRERLWPLPIIRLDSLSPPGAGESDSFNPYLSATLHSMEAGRGDERLSEGVLAQQTLASYLKLRMRDAEQAQPNGVFPVLVLDQFEELFTLDRYDWERKQAFIQQLGKLLSEGIDLGPGEDGTPRVQQVWALFSMREDYVAELEPYLDLIPTALTFRYRLEPLDRTQAVEAIVGPAAGWFEAAAAERLVSDLSGTGQPGERNTKQGRYVEPVQLQVVSLRLWDKVVIGEQRAITAADINADGQSNEVDTALEEYYQVELNRASAGRKIRERTLRDWIESKLLTDSQARTRVLREIGVDPALDEAVDSLIDGHLLRADTSGERTWLELSHDRLVRPILDNNQKWRESHLQLVQKRAMQWIKENRAENLLLNPAELLKAQEFVEEHPGELNPLECEFLQESRDLQAELQEQARRNEQIRADNRRLGKRLGIAAGLIGSLVFGLVIVAIAWISANDAKDAAEKAKIAADQQRTEALQAKYQAQERLLQARMMEANVQTDSGRSLSSLSLLEPGTSVSMQAMYFRSLLKALGSSPPLTRVVGQGHVVKGLQFSADGGQLYSGDWNGQTFAWPLAGDEAPGQSLDNDAGQSIQSLAYNPLRKLLVSANRIGAMVLWQEGGAAPVELARFNARDVSVDRGVLMSAQFDASGQWLVTPGNRRRQPSLSVWSLADLAKPAVVATLSGYHTTNISRVTFVPAGKYAGYLVSADTEGNLALWKLPATATAPVVTLHTLDVIRKKVGVFAATVDPSGRWLAAGTADGSLLFWDLWAQKPGDSGVVVPSFMHHGRVTAMAFSRKGDKLYSVGGDKLLLEWTLPEQAAKPLDTQQLASAIQVVRVDGWGEKLYSIALHPQQEGIVAVGGGTQIRMLDLNRMTPLTSRMTGSEGPWRAMSASHDQQVVVGLSANTLSVRRWYRREANAQAQSLDFPGPERRLTTLALSGDGHTLADLTCDGYLQVWDVTGDTPQRRLESRAGRQELQCRSERDESVAFQPGGQLLASAFGNQLKLWAQDTNGGWSLVGQHALAEQLRIKALAFSPSGKQLAIAGDWGVIELWSTDGGALSQVNQVSAGAQALITALAFSSNGERLASGGDDASVIEWRVADLQLLGSSQWHNRAVSSIAYLAQFDSTLLVSGDREGQMVLCATPVSEEQCSPVGSPRGTPISAMAAVADELLVSSNALWQWQLQSQVMRAAAQRLARRPTAVVEVPTQAQAQ